MPGARQPEPRPPLSAEARGRLRVLWAQLEVDADRIEAAARRVPPALARDARRAFGRRADAALAHIVDSIPVLPIARDRRTAAWRYMRPVGDARRSAVRVMALLLNAHGLPGLSMQAFGLEVSRHALGRLLDRSQFRADPVRAVLEAHASLLNLTPAEGDRLFSLPAFPLPAERGAFLVSLNGAEDRPMALARTWIDGDQLFDDQQKHIDNWSILQRTKMYSAAWT